MTPDIRKKIEDAADKYGDQATDDHGVVVGEYVTFSLLTLENAFTAGAEFGLGLARSENHETHKLFSRDASRMAKQSMCQQHEIHDLRKERDALAARVKELEADRSMVTNKWIDARDRVEELEFEIARLRNGVDEYMDWRAQYEKENSKLRAALERLTLVGPPSRSCTGAEICFIQLSDNCEIARKALEADKGE